MGVKTENKMAYEPVNKLIIQMSAPPLISMFFQYSYNLVDSMFVAGINEQALAAVSLAFPITTLMNALSVWIGVGVNVLIAGYLGQKNQQKANSAAALGVVISVVVGVLINFLSLFIINPYYSAFTQNKEIFEYGIAYMSVCVFMQIPNMVHIVIQKILQATDSLCPIFKSIIGQILLLIGCPSISIVVSKDNVCPVFDGLDVTPLNSVSLSLYQNPLSFCTLQRKPL
jgi:Na+-driven multidrug efflux pump